MNGNYALWYLSACVLLSGCLLSTTVKRVNNEQPVAAPHAFNEEFLLDIGIRTFDPNVPESTKEVEKKGIQPDVRNAESYYIPYALKTTLEKTGNWGVVRILPTAAAPFDVNVSGKILRSDGEELAMDVEVRDASGKKWFAKTYKLTAGKLHYSKSATRKGDPFQEVYTKISDDMLAYRLKISDQRLQKISQAKKLRFAAAFLPEIYNDYVSVDKRGRIKILRLPAENDPMFERLLAVQDRENMFIDTLDQHYADFRDKMETPYLDWRKFTYEEVIALRELRKQARTRALLGIASVVGGIIAAGESNSAVGRAAGNVAVLGGAAAIASGISKGQESKLHSETIKELNAGFNADMAPQTLELEERKVALSGSVERQYETWRTFLREIYAAETGVKLNAENPSSTP